MMNCCEFGLWALVNPSLNLGVQEHLFSGSRQGAMLESSVEHETARQLESALESVTVQLDKPISMRTIGFMNHDNCDIIFWV